MYKVIVADDEQMERMAVVHILKNSGLPVTIVGEATDGLEAVELFMDMGPDIVIIDIRMPCKDGLEAACEMQNTGMDLVTIFLTAYDEFEYAQKAVRLGALDYILKPVRPEEVVMTVNRAIEELDKRRRITRQHTALHGQTNSGKPVARSSLVFNLTNSSFNLDEIKKLAGFLEMDHSSKIVLVFGMDGEKRNGAAEAKQRISSILDEENYLFQKVLMTSMETDSDKVVVLVSLKESKDDNEIKHLIRAWANDIREKFFARGWGTITIGIGKPFRELKRMRESFAQAAKAFRPGAFPFTGEHLPDSAESQYTSGCGDKEKILYEHIASREWDCVKNSFKEWFSGIVHSNEPLYRKRVRIAEMIIIISRSVMDDGADRDKVFGLVVDFYSRLNASDDLTHMDEYALRTIQEFAHIISDCQKPYSARIISKATEYMKKYYRCRNIRMGEVAKAVNLSPHYFSRIFKQETDSTFLDYLTELRIEKAKQLLRDQSITINEVAQAVGYLEACYFSRVFKKHEGLSPSAYRTRMKEASR